MHDAFFGRCVTSECNQALVSGAFLAPVVHQTWVEPRRRIGVGRYGRTVLARATGFVACVQNNTPCCGHSPARGGVCTRDTSTTFILYVSWLLCAILVVHAVLEDLAKVDSDDILVIAEDRHLTQCAKVWFARVKMINRNTWFVVHFDYVDERLLSGRQFSCCDSKPTPELDVTSQKKLRFRCRMLHKTTSTPPNW